jgi:hypothetical protein
MAELVGRIQRVPWPQWNEPGARMRREVVELCRPQAARGLTVLSWLADGGTPGDTGWLLTTARLTGPRRQRMYGAGRCRSSPIRAARCRRNPRRDRGSAAFWDVSDRSDRVVPVFSERHQW